MQSPAGTTVRALVCAVLAGPYLTPRADQPRCTHGIASGRDAGKVLGLVALVQY